MSLKINEIICIENGFLSAICVVIIFILAYFLNAAEGIGYFDSGFLLFLIWILLNQLRLNKR